MDPTSTGPMRCPGLPRLDEGLLPETPPTRSWTASRALLQIRQEARHSGHSAGLDEGKRLGKAEDILMVLRARGFTLPEEVAGRILSCQDTEQLTRWLLRSVTLQRIEDLFAP